MALFGHPIALAVAFVGLTGTAAAQPSSNSTDTSATGVWEDNTTNSVSQSIDRGVAERCGAGDTNCRGGTASAGASRGATSGASGMPGNAPRANGAGGAVPAGTEDGSEYRQW